MRKSVKKALSLVLSTAMTLTMGQGLTFNQSAVKAAGTSAGASNTASGGATNASSDAIAASASSGAVQTPEETPGVRKPIVARLGFQTGGGYDYRDAADVDSEVWNYKYSLWREENGLPALDYGYDVEGYYHIYRGGRGPKWDDIEDAWTTNYKQFQDTDGTWKNIKDETTGRGKKFTSAELAVPATSAVITDQVMNEDGTYTVSISGLDLTTMPSDWDQQAYTNTGFNMIYVSVNAPLSNETNKNATAIATSFKIDGVEQLAEGERVTMPRKSIEDQANVLQFMLANSYDKKEDETGFAKYGGETASAVNPGNYLTVLPHDSLEITFEIAGVDWNSSGVSNVGADLPRRTRPPVQTVEPVAEITPDPLSTAIDVFLAANVNPGLTPDDADATTLTDANGKRLQAAVFSSREMETTVKTAKKNAEGALLNNFDANPPEIYWAEEPEGSLHIDQTGNYSISVTAKGETDDLVGISGDAGAIWMPVLIGGGNYTMPSDFTLKGTSIQVGEAVYAWPAELMQDSANSVRLSVVNQWASAAEKARANPVTTKIAVNKGDKVTFNFAVVKEAPPAAVTATPAAVATAAASSYDAYLGFQTNTWVYHDEINHDTNGLDSKTYDYLKQIGYAQDGKTATMDVTFTNAKMTENSVTYNVGVSGMNLATLKTDSGISEHFNMLYVTTNIPLAMKGVTMKNAVLKIDGNVVKEFEVVPCKADANTYYQFMLADTYAPDDKTPDVFYDKNNPLKVIPTDKIEISYTIDGIDFNRVIIGPSKGKKFNKGDFQYKVTKEAVQAGDGTISKGAVQLVGLTKAGKKKASLSVPATAKVTSGEAVGTFKIATMKSAAFKGSAKLKKIDFQKATNLKALSSKAFMNCKKLTAVTLNKKMTKIPASAFKGCKKLNKLTFKAKLKSVSKTAFKGCSKKIKIAGTSAKANKKKIKKVYKKVK